MICIKISPWCCDNTSRQRVDKEQDFARWTNRLQQSHYLHGCPPPPPLTRGGEDSYADTSYDVMKRHEKLNKPIGVYLF